MGWFYAIPSDPGKKPTPKERLQSLQSLPIIVRSEWIFGVVEKDVGGIDGGAGMFERELCGVTYLGIGSVLCCLE